MDTTDATVLLIDDDAELRKAVSRLLRSAGWTTRGYASADEFIADGGFEGTGCLLLDINMPGTTGPELHAWLLDHSITLPVIYLSGQVDVRTSVLAMKRGAVDVFEKHVDAKTLLLAVDDAIETHRQDRLRRQSCDEIGSRLASLSPREREVMEHVIQGRLNKQIAADLGIVLQTVKVHRGRAMAKMRAQSVLELAQMCQQLGIAR